MAKKVFQHHEADDYLKALIAQNNWTRGFTEACYLQGNTIGPSQRTQTELLSLQDELERIVKNGDF